MRKLAHHEARLLKKVNFLAYKNEHNLRELQVRSRQQASPSLPLGHWQHGLPPWAGHGPPLLTAHARRLQTMRRYHIQDRDDYKKYNKLVGMVTKMTSTLKRLDPKDSTRIELTDQLLDK